VLTRRGVPAACFLLLVFMFSCTPLNPGGEPPTAVSSPSAGNVVITLTSIPSPGATETSITKTTSLPSAALAASDLKITNLREGRTENTLPLSLSPDGQWLLASDAAGVCVLKVETLTEQYCTKWGGHVIATNLGWSPDGKHVAFSENVQRYFEESDIWVMDTDPGKLTDMTDDGITGSALNSQALLDTSPAYSPDGRDLIFARTAEQNGTTTSIFRMRDNGAPEKLITVDTEYSSSLYGKMFWSGDGKKIFYTIFRQGTRDDPENGIWVVDSEGQNPQQLLGMSQTEGVPVLLAVNPQGDKALIIYSVAFESALLGVPAPGQSGKDYLLLFDIKTGATEPVILAESQPDETLLPIAATFSPEGSKILYIYNSSIRKQQLAVRDVSGSHETILYSPEQPFGTRFPGQMELDWAGNDTIYISTLPNTGTLFHIGK
jgi:dipeptidyl aminopeptidase/acylaminoacyl peptidase